MIQNILLIWIGIQIGAPVWFYVVCGALICIDVIVAAIKALKEN